MEFYNIKVSDLYEKVKLMVEDGMETVEIQLLPAEPDLPASVNFIAYCSAEPGIGIDYEDIEVIPR